MTDLDAAIILLDTEFDALPKAEVGTAAWWIVRARSHGLSLLRVLKVKKLTDPVAAEAFRKDLRFQMQTLEVE